MAVEENLIDLDFDVVETKNPEDDCLKQLAAFERSDAKRNQMILVRLWPCLSLEKIVANSFFLLLFSESSWRKSKVERSLGAADIRFCPKIE